jgi:site-specific DNA-adenine methylase
MTRPIGLLFLGSKKRVQKDIFTLYQYLNPNWITTPFIDLFAGGGAIGLYFATKGVQDITMNCYPEKYANALKTILFEDIDITTLICTREEFFAIDKESTDGVDVLKRLCNSFGNDEKSYLYSKENSEMKYNLAIEIIKNHPDTWGQYKQTQMYKDAFKASTPEQQLVWLQQLSQIQQLERVKRFNHKDNINIISKDYKEVPIKKDAFYYLDPPYFDCTTEGYSPIDFNEFICWVKDNNIKGILSHYEDDRLTEHFGKFQPLGHGSNYRTKKEKKIEGFYLVNIELCK